MDGVRCTIRVDYVDHLHVAVALAAADDQPLVVTDPARVRTNRPADDRLDLGNGAAMAGGMLEVPEVPPEVHDFII